MKQRILIIDDEPDFCGIMKIHFQKKNFEVEFATSLGEGLESLKKNNPDILFLDNNLPDGDGWEIVEKVVDLIPHIRIYLISAHKNRPSYKGPVKNVVIWEKPISLKLLNECF